MTKYLQLIHIFGRFSEVHYLLIGLIVCFDHWDRFFHSECSVCDYILDKTRPLRLLSYNDSLSYSITLRKIPNLC